MRQLKPHLFFMNGQWACCSRELGALIFGGPTPIDAYSSWWAVTQWSRKALRELDHVWH